MRLTQIQATGLKGSDGTPVELAPVTLIVGANASGKTTVLDAAVLAALGRHPDWPRTNDGVLAAAAGDDIEVVATFDDDVVLRRSWTRKVVKSGREIGEVKASSDVRISTTKATTKATRVRCAIEYLGLPQGKQAREDAEAALDVRAFLRLSDDKKRELLLRLSADAVAATWSRSQVGEALAPELRDVLDDWDKGEDVAAFVSRQALQSRDAANAAAKDHRQAVAAADELDDDAEPIEPAVVGRLRQQVDDAEEEELRIATTTEGRIEKARAKVEAGEAKHRAGATAQRLADADRAELKRLRSVSTDNEHLERLRTELEDVEEGWGGIPVLKDDAIGARTAMEAGPDRSALAALDEQLAALATPLDATELDLSELDLELKTWRERVTSDTAAERKLETEHAQASAAATAASDKHTGLLAVVVSLEGEGWEEVECPTCRQPVGEDALDELRKLLGEAEAAAKEADEHAQSVEQRLNRTHEELSEAEIHVADLDAQRTQRERDHQDEAARAARKRSLLVSDLKGKRVRTSDEIDAQVEALRRAWRAAEDAVRTAEQRRDELLRQIRAGESTEPDAQRIATIEGRIAELDKGTVGLPDLEDLRGGLAEAERQAVQARDQAKEVVDRLGLELEQLERKLTERTQAERIKAKAAELEEQLGVAKERATALGARGLLGQVMRTVLDPFESGVNAFLEGLGLGRFAVGLEDARGNEVFRPGLARERSFTPVQTLSQSERTVVCAGLSLALGKLAGLPWRPVFVDEIQSLDGPRWTNRRRRFLERLVHLVDSGEASQALVLGCPDDLADVPGAVAVVVLDEPEAGRAAA